MIWKYLLVRSERRATLEWGRRRLHWRASDDHLSSFLGVFEETPVEVDSRLDIHRHCSEQTFPRDVPWEEEYPSKLTIL